MLYSRKAPTAKRADLRAALTGGGLLRFAGAFSPVVAQLIEEIGFDGVYLGSSMLSADLGLPDIGLVTLSEAAARGGAISRVTALPTLIDIDTGYGETVNVARTMQELEDAGLAGFHLEDQINPKRCGHLDNKALVEPTAMVEKIRAAVAARRDPDFLIMARTDARAVEGMDAAIDRAKAYVDAGADAIFPEAMADEAEFAAFRDAIDVPLLANMTEFGKSKLLGADSLRDLGYNMVIYPATAFRLAMRAVEDGLRQVEADGDQTQIIDRLMTRKRFYQLIGYDEYGQFDQSIADFELDP